MSAQVPARRAQLVIASDSVEPAEMSRLLGVKSDRETWVGQIPQGAIVRRPALDNSWEIGESGGSSADVSALLESLFVRIRPVADRIRQLRDRGCRVIVSVVQYVSPDDPETEFHSCRSGGAARSACTVD
jgi:hypothetical protein